jgi:hypothetical protein
MVNEYPLKLCETGSRSAKKLPKASHPMQKDDENEWLLSESDC